MARFSLRTCHQVMDQSETPVHSVHYQQVTFVILFKYSSSSGGISLPAPCDIFPAIAPIAALFLPAVYQPCACAHMGMMQFHCLNIPE